MEIGELITKIGELITDLLLGAKEPPHKAGHLTVISQTVAISPSNRSRTKIGVGEKVRIKVQGATGGTTWSITSSSKLSATSGAIVKLTAHDRAESTTVTATGDCGCKVDITFDVIEPDSIMQERVPGTGIWHTHNIPSVGMKLNIYIKPDTVSFENIEISEDDCAAVVTGYFSGTALDGIRHAGHGAGHWAGVGACVAGKGSMVRGQDTVQSGHCDFGKPFSNGTFSWPIPWRFRVGGGASKVFGTANHIMTINAHGDMTISKAGANASVAYGNPSSSY